ncbi:PilZ domain-containing protein [Kineosporia rhizophila]|uniref:PilZ domain-containing protein n=1 Tax=Kineosporia TaxID=49184 RepID=UPI001E2DC737|nr:MULTISPECIES: PilZ domain-containing protein [Kineosporia]MCE0539467.1 PilZ domain-containing protein [Kineosporia rhizophila]GLY18468.1 hypothetical protein Kisp01_54820 [Kineosporia sp. NBRC 101677]
MASVAAGSRLVVRSGEVGVTLRVLRGVDVGRAGWAVPVLADLEHLKSLVDAGLRVVVEIPAEDGPLRVEAELVVTEADLTLRAPRARPTRAIRAAALTDQRRENVRGPVQLEFRGTLMQRPPTTPRGRRRSPGYLAALGPGDGAQADLVGTTTSVSAGGVCVDLEQGRPLAEGLTLYGEITLPNGDLVPALLLVVEQTPQGFRAEFTDISPIDSERLVRLVFDRERSGLAKRG